MGPGDRVFIRWAKSFCSITADDADRIRIAYKKAGLITIDNKKETFRVLNFAAITRVALEAAAENLRPRSRRWNDLTDDERQRLVSSKRSVPEQWEKQERIELAIAKLEK